MEQGAEGEETGARGAVTTTPSMAHVGPCSCLCGCFPTRSAPWPTPTAWPALPPGLSPHPPCPLSPPPHPTASPSAGPAAPIAGFPLPALGHLRLHLLECQQFHCCHLPLHLDGLRCGKPLLYLPLHSHHSSPESCFLPATAARICSSAETAAKPTGMTAVVSYKSPNRKFGRRLVPH